MTNSKKYPKTNANANANANAKTISAKILGISQADLPNSIIEIITTLTKAGFEAYVVGGGVRDILLGQNPKDFDAVTNAKPHEVKDVFGKRCRIIGRRFELAHVFSGRDMIEVATFRAPPKGDAHTTEDGMLMRDNVWGDINQDFARRDFSVNALYYQPLKGEIKDFCGAIDDIQSKTLKLLGHASVRVEEDPVRLLRALRFKAKLGFEFDDELAKQFNNKNWALLEQVSPHRLYDETQKMFIGGYIVPLLPLLFEYQAIEQLMVYPPNAPTALLKQVAMNTDKRIASGKSINPAFFYAALLWENYLYQLNKFKKQGHHFADAQEKAASKVIDRQRLKTAIPRFAEQFIKDIWLLQPRLANPKHKQILTISEHARFRAGFDFLLLREMAGEDDIAFSEPTNGMGVWWQTFQTMNDREQRYAIDRLTNQDRRSSKHRRQRLQSYDMDDSSDRMATDTFANHQLHTGLHAGEQSNTQTNANRHAEHNHRQKEKAQLQQLSLSEQTLSEQAQKKQPSPLFTVLTSDATQETPKQTTIKKQNKQQQKSKQNISQHHKTKDAVQNVVQDTVQDIVQNTVQNTTRNAVPDAVIPLTPNQAKNELSHYLPIPNQRRHKKMSSMT